MDMQRIWRLLIIVFLASQMLPLAAQAYDDWDDEEEPASSLIDADWDDDEEEPVPPPIDANWDDYAPVLYARGDMTIAISLGVLIPAYFTGPGMRGPHNLSTGGTGSLSYSYFFTSSFFVGGELGFSFSATIASDMLYVVPFGVHAGYQFGLGRFEFPVRLMIGAAPQRYQQKSYLGLTVKPAVSGFFRFNNEWSFGLNLQWWMLPQWPRDGNNVFGNFMEITLSAKYRL